MARTLKLLAALVKIVLGSVMGPPVILFSSSKLGAEAPDFACGAHLQGERYPTSPLCMTARATRRGGRRGHRAAVQVGIYAVFPMQLPGVRPRKVQRASQCVRSHHRPGINDNVQAISQRACTRRKPERWSSPSRSESRSSMRAMACSCGIPWVASLFSRRGGREGRERAKVSKRGPYKVSANDVAWTLGSPQSCMNMA